MKCRGSEDAAGKRKCIPAQNILSGTCAAAENPVAREQIRQQEAELVETHMGLARAVAIRLSRVYNGMTQADTEDLLQIGYIGLLKAVRGFDPERGLAFSTYAVPVITGEIKSQIRDHSSIKMSRQLKRNAALIRRAQNQFMIQHGTSPHMTDLTQMTGMSMEQVLEAVAAADAQQPMQSLSELSSGQSGERKSGYQPSAVRFACGEGNMTAGFMGNQSEFLSDDEEQRIERMDLACVLSRLENRQRQVIILRYYRDFTQQQIADKMGISQVQVSRIEKKALKAMAENLENPTL